MFAANAGMFDPALKPVGLYVEQGRELAHLNTRSAHGNFHMKPNGVYVSADAAGVVDTPTFLQQKPRAQLATQSGPMLVINGRLHPRFNRRSTSLKARDGVGVRADGKVLFAISEGEVSFDAFARLFRDGLNCPNALFLDGGSAATLYMPSRNSVRQHRAAWPDAGRIREKQMSILNLPRPAWMSDDVVMLEEQARRFIAAEYVPQLDAWNERGMYEREEWTKAGAAGLLCPAIPEQYGGAGGSFAHEAVIIRQLGLAGFDSFGAPLHSGIVAPYILHYGTEEQKQRWLPRLVTGELIGAIAMSEPGTGSDLQGVRTSAKKSGNGYVLSGAKTFITNGQHANFIVVVAKTDPGAGSKGVSLLVVETDDASGFRRGRKLNKLG